MKKPLAIAALLLAAALLAGAYAAWRPQESALPDGRGAGAAPLKPHRTAPAGYKEYYNERYRFSLFYPDTLSVSEQPGEQGTETISFEDTEAAQGFEIYALPYGQPQVSQERFQKDDPSGVRDGLRTVTVDGATGASFFGSDPRLGGTAEVWLLHGGYLFEVAAPKPLASWLSGIMGSWVFI